MSERESAAVIDAAKAGDLEGLRAAYEAGGSAALLYADDWYEMTAAHWAAKEGDVAVLRLLNELGAGATLKARDENRSTPAHFAAEAGQDDALRVLHECGAATTLTDVNTADATPAHWAAFAGNDTTLRVLYELGAGASFNALTIEGSTPAHEAAERGRDGVLRVLHELGAGATFFVGAGSGYTPAHYAAHGGHDGALRVLAAAGADFEAVTAWGSTPEDFASGIDGHPGTAALLKSVAGLPAFRIAVQLRGPVTVLRRALRRGDVDPDGCVGQVQVTMAAAAASGAPELIALVQLAFGLGRAADPRHLFSGWRPANHWLHHRRFRAAVEAMLTVAVRLPVVRPELPHVPWEVWCAVLAQLSRRDFP